MWHIRMEEMGSPLPHELVPEPAPVPDEENPGEDVPQEPSSDMENEIYRLMDEKPEETA